MKKSAFFLTVAIAAGCVGSASAAKKLPAPAVDVRSASGTKTAVFAAGCFWCVEAVFEQLGGVADVQSGYAGDSEANAKYKLVSRGATQHAEVVQITYDASKISYGQLLHVLFSTHDPTTLNRQGPDRGTQYRSAVFFANEEERKVAAAYIAQLNAAKVFQNPIVTTLEKLAKFYPAEQYHQDFVRLNPNHGYVRMWALPKVAKTLELFPKLIRQQQ
jgi:peptide-methionine (S)-S-oxide reductase